MELKHLRGEAMIALDELDTNDCIDCEYHEDCCEFCNSQCDHRQSADVLSESDLRQFRFFPFHFLQRS